VQGDADVGGDLERAGAGENGGAGIALLLGAVPIGGVVARPELFDVVGGATGFLEAEDVGLFGVEEFEEVAFEEGAEAVDVPGNQFHGGNKA